MLSRSLNGVTLDNPAVARKLWHSPSARRKRDMMTHDAPVGILMLDSRFPRIPGDIGNPVSWPCPVLMRTVEAASPDRVVRQDPADLLPAFIAAGQALVAEGAVCVTTSCGFLSVFQEDLARALPVPVLTSSLLQVAAVNRLLSPGKRAGILTISAASLSTRHLALSGVPEGTPVGTTEGGQEFTRAILSNAPEMDLAKARADNVSAARALQAAHPDLGAIVLECTNMGPYAADIREATGLPVFSILTFVCWLRAALVPPAW
jgi:Asp/Glu/hydantoin racemase